MDNNGKTLVHERFSRRAALRAETVAVEQGDRRISYAELERRSNHLSHRLRIHGIGPGSTVMVHMERSIDLVVSLLATLKAGASYLPVEPGVPDHRIATLIGETGCGAVITGPGNVSHLTEHNLVLLEPESGRDPSLALPDTPPEVPVAETDCAYTIYTSGSTGAPKGIRVAHASLRYLVDEINQRYGVTPDDRVLQFASITFDTSIEQILNTLLNGATLVLPDDVWPPNELPLELTRHRVSVMDLTPSYWRAFLAELATMPTEPPVRLTIVGGSAVHAEDCRTALRLMPNSRLVNAYGLTETTITSCTMEITAAALPESGSAPVGRPLPGTVVRVLDEDARPVQPGQPGEVHISGHGVALGYLTRSADHSRFRPDPWAERADTRMYRTGDLGRWTHEGNLEILGRADRQLKVRGFRVEPAEIEAALTAHEMIADAVVEPYDRDGETEIAAYYVPAAADAPPLGTRELRSHVNEWLPGYMIPATFVRLAEMPLKDNGKVDVAALPPPGQPAEPHSGERADDSDSTVGLVERAVAEMWRQVLGLEHVEPGDGFFELGGNSIRAAELLAKVRASLGVMITQVRPLIRSLLDGATLRGFAAAVESARAGTFSVDAESVDFGTETALDVPVGDSPPDPADWKNPANILLTGATGFLGIYLLRELLTTTDATVHCLVRAEDPDRAMERLRANARHYFGHELDEYRRNERIRAVPGDLAEERLGLSEEEFDQLSQLVDVIHHPGGLVNFIYPYTHMRAANVEGTREIIRMAARYRNAPVHYTSTMAVISGFGTAGIGHVTEETPADHVDHLSVGYVESKWVAEELLRKAARRGLPVAVYRAADISGDSVTGAWNTATEMCAMKKFIVDTGTAPVAELPLDYTPVDHFAAAVAHIAAGEPARGEIYHLTNPGKANISLLVERLRSHGHEVRAVSWDEWVERIVEVAVEQPDHPMTPFAPLFIDRCSTAAMSVAEMYLETTFPTFSRDNVEKALQGSGIAIPPVDGEMLDRYIRHLTTVDFL
ncbi:non-ribosomal peptide synthetase [Actinopolyspora erythraea]|uniref:Non-ribosomal peptide synthetase n=1 Tax=Actinopolyspora erythraea TaxID=414996 RepID=A0A223RSW7_9ACTN|nr:non-ribosomal peptide synthetase [Actinopolyspora erythraea]ASU78966.1 non-ribosomal peptide synthetase [Actinopolyspora erythraea]